MTSSTLKIFCKRICVGMNFVLLSVKRCSELVFPRRKLKPLWSLNHFNNLNFVKLLAMNVNLYAKNKKINYKKHIAIHYVYYCNVQRNLLALWWWGAYIGVKEIQWFIELLCRLEKCFFLYYFHFIFLFWSYISPLLSSFVL